MVTLLLFQNIANMAEINDMVLERQLDAAILNPKYVYHPEQLLVAAHKSLFQKNQESLQTKTVYTEVLYNLYPGRSIRDALKTFGVKEDNREAAFVVFDDENKAVSDRIRKLVKGEALSFDSLSEVNDNQSILDLYKIPSHASHKDDILQFILTRMATRDLL